MSEGRVKALESSMSLREFLRADRELSAEQRVLIARQALLMLEQKLRAPAAEVRQVCGESPSAAASAHRQAEPGRGS